MNELRAVRRIRPDIEPLDETTSEAIWQRIIGDTYIGVPQPYVPTIADLDSHNDTATTTNQPQSPRRVLAVAAMTLAVIGLGGIWAITTGRGDDGSSSVQPPGGGTSTPSVQTSFGYEVTSNEGTEIIAPISIDDTGVCIRVVIDDQRSEGCIEAEVIATGLAWGLHSDPSGGWELTGVVPDAIDTVEVDGRPVMLVGNVWSAHVDVTPVELRVGDSTAGRWASTTIDVGEPLSTTTVASPSTTRPTTTIASTADPAFAPLVVAEPPTGFTFLSAGFDPGPGGVGIAHYGRPGDDTQFQIINRHQPDGEQRMRELSRTSFQVDGLTVYTDGEADGRCLPDVCSIGVQWDDQTFTSLLWVAVDGGELDQDATIETLLELVPRLIADPTQWSPTGLTER